MATEINQLPLPSDIEIDSIKVIPLEMFKKQLDMLIMAIPTPYKPENKDFARQDVRVPIELTQAFLWILYSKEDYITASRVLNHYRRWKSIIEKAIDDDNFDIFEVTDQTSLEKCLRDRILLSDISNPSIPRYQLCIRELFGCLHEEFLSQDVTTDWVMAEHRRDQHFLFEHDKGVDDTNG